MNNYSATQQMVMKGPTLNAIFPRASKSFLQANRALSNPKSEQVVRHESVATVKRKKENPRCRILRITSYRTRLLDTDNLCPKYFVDALRYAGTIRDDSTKHIDLQVRQEKVKHRKEEKTVIEIEL